MNDFQVKEGCGHVADSNMAPSFGISKLMNTGGGGGKLTRDDDNERRLNHCSSSGCHVAVSDVAPRIHVSGDNE